MPHYWIAIHRPDDYDPATEGEAMGRAIARLNERMIAAGVRRWACGLGSRAVSLRARADGDVGEAVTETGGLYLSAGGHGGEHGGEHVGGFWILECADFGEAVAWGREAVGACRAGVEVREMLQKPPAVTG